MGGLASRRFPAIPLARVEDLAQLPGAPGLLAHLPGWGSQKVPSRNVLEGPSSKRVDDPAVWGTAEPLHLRNVREGSNELGFFGWVLKAAERLQDLVVAVS